MSAANVALWEERAGRSASSAARPHLAHAVRAAFETRAAVFHYRRAMVDRFPGKPSSFGALRKTFGPLYLCCDICRRFALLQLGAHELRDVDYRTKRFSCSVCGDEAWLTVTDPRTERGMGDYRLDQREQPERHPHTVERLTGKHQPSSVHLIGGALPGRKIDGRRQSTRDTELPRDLPADQ